MKTIVLAMAFFTLMGCILLQAEDFKLGCYSYLKANQDLSALNDSLISYMSQADYNLTICDTNEQSGQTDTNALLGKLSNAGIDAWLADYAREDPSTQTIGSHTASTANNWRFEAEYESESDDNENLDLYHYKFDGDFSSDALIQNINPDYDTRVGEYDETSHPGMVVWHCGSDDEGIALYGMTYRWKNYDAGFMQGTLTDNEKNFGPEIKFASWEDYWQDNPGECQSYYSGQNLYLTFRFSIDSIRQPYDPKIEFRCAFKTVSQWFLVPIANTKFPGLGPEICHDYSYDELISSQYSDPDTSPGSSGFRFITFEIDLWYLRSHGFINTSNNWVSCLYGINPLIIKKDGITLDLDYMEICDTMFNSIDHDNPNNPTPITIRDNSSVEKYYSLDEPSQLQFKSLRTINNDYTMSALSTINCHGVAMKKPDNTRFSLQKLYLSLDDAEYRTPELMTDCYPLVPNHFWNRDAQHTPTQGDRLSMQWDLDWHTLRHYRELRKATRRITNRKSLYVVPPTYGEWDQTHDIWINHLYPTPQMAKCLQLLPLCFDVDGIINYKFRDHIPAAGPSDPRHIPEFNEYQPTDNQVGTQMYSLVDVQGTYPNFTYEPSSLYYAICEANSKIKCYAEYINNYSAPGDTLTWLDSAIIGSDGVFLTPDAYYDNSVSSYIWSDYLTSLTTPDAIGQNHYVGYVQCGFYRTIPDDHPIYMLVNRRTNFREDSSQPTDEGSFETLPAYQIRNGIGYSVAPPQTVSFTPNNSASNMFGDYIALYDPYDDSISHPLSESNPEIQVAIGPGDGRLLEMVGSLPHNVSTPKSLSGKVVIDGNIQVNHPVTTSPTSNVTILSGSTFIVSAMMQLQGDINIGDNVSFVIQDQGWLDISNATCSWGNGSQIVCNGRSAGFSDSSVKMGNDVLIEINSGECIVTNSDLTLGSNCIIRISNADLFVSGSSLDSFADGITWAGLDANNSSRIDLSNSTIKNMLCNKISNSDLVMEDCRVEVPLRGSGLSLCGDIQGPTTTITCSSETSGFYASKDNTIGIEIALMSNPVIVQGAKFVGLTKGIFKVASSASQDEISYCSFENCSIGIHCISPEYHGIVRNCGFHQSNPLNEYTGIKLQGSAPMITDCQFTNLDLGIDTEYSLQTYSRGVKYSNFVNCKTGIRSRESSIGVWNNYFTQNQTGILNLPGSNLNLSAWAGNVLNNLSANIAFFGSDPYKATVQLVSGHNDFYHLFNDVTNDLAYDFSFDANYYNYSVPTGNAIIDVSWNWFEDNNVRWIHPDNVNYTYYGDLDPANNSPAPPPPNDRLCAALDLEAQEDYPGAMTLYKAILDDNLEIEKRYLPSATDGVFRLSNLVNFPDWNAPDYFDAKAIQYAIDDPYLSRLLKDYLGKTLIISKEYQAAIDLIQLRIANPESEVDSLLAVLDLEIVLQLAAMDEGRQSVSTLYVQYKYPDLGVFEARHQEHLDQYCELVRSGNPLNTPVSPVPVITTNYPNPFNPSTSIGFSLPERSLVKIRVFNSRGQLVRNLLDDIREKGQHTIVWDGKDGFGCSVSSGIYYIRLASGGQGATRKVMLLK